MVYWLILHHHSTYFCMFINIKDVYLLYISKPVSGSSDTCDTTPPLSVSVILIFLFIIFLLGRFLLALPFSSCPSFCLQVLSFLLTTFLFQNVFLIRLVIIRAGNEIINFSGIIHTIRQQARTRYVPSSIRKNHIHPS